MNDKKDKKILYKFLIPFLGGLFLTFSRQFLFLFSNQNTYFLYGLRLFDPNFIPNDWFTWQTFHHDFAFGYLLYFLQKLGPLSIMVVITEFLAMTALSFGLLILVRRYCKHPYAVYLSLLAWIRLVSPAEIGLGGQYLIGGHLQPSEVAGPLMILGIALLLKQNYFSSGIILGLAGLFHGAFLSSFGPAILITALFTGFWRKFKPFFLFTIPLLFLWGIFIFVIIKALSSSVPMSNDIASIMINVRAPGDFIISNWPFKWTLSWLMWIIMGLIVIYKLRKIQRYKILIICFFTILLTNIFGVLQAIWIKIPTITLMMLWRSSSLLTILSVMLATDYGIFLILGNKERLKKNVIFIITFLISSSILINTSWGPQISRIHFLWLTAIPLAGITSFIISKISHQRIARSRIIFMLIVIVPLVIMAVYLRGYFGKYNNYLVNPPSISIAKLEQWIRDNTPKDVILVIPPDMEYMRIRVQRAIIVDWKSACYLPCDLQEWYQRLIGISGLSPTDNLPNYQEILNGYRQLDYNRVAYLSKKYKASYVVIENKKHLGNLTGLKEKYANEEYRVFEIPKIN